MAQSKAYRAYLSRCRRQRPEVKAKEKEYRDRYRATHPDWNKNREQYDKTYYENNRTKKIRENTLFNNRSCHDPIAGDVCRYNTLVQRKRYHPDWYKDVRPGDCLIKVPTIKGMDEELRKEYNM